MVMMIALLCPLFFKVLVQGWSQDFGRVVGGGGGGGGGGVSNYFYFI